MKPTPLVLSAAAAVGLLVAGIAIGAPKTKPPPAAPAAPAYPEPSADGFIHLEKHVFSSDRARWCSFVELARAPERQGQAVTVQYEYSSKGKGLPSARTWRYLDESGRLTLSGDGSNCFSNANANLPTGKFAMPLVIETATVAIDPAQDALLAADPAWLQCFESFPENIVSNIVIPVVVDTDGRVWASDGTRETDNFRDCLGAAATAWAKTQVDAKTFPLVAPAVVFGLVEAAARPDADPKGKALNAPAGK